MKKIYINPNLLVVRIQTTGMLAVSLPKGDPNSDSDGVVDEGDVLGRDSDWDEDY